MSFPTVESEPFQPFQSLFAQLHNKMLMLGNCGTRTKLTDTDSFSRFDIERNIVKDLGTSWRVSCGKFFHAEIARRRPVRRGLAVFSGFGFLLNLNIALDSLQTMEDVSSQGIGVTE